MELKEDPVDHKPPFNYHKCSSCRFRTKSSEAILFHFKKHQPESKTDRFSCETANLEDFECQDCDFEHDLKIVILDRHISSAHGEGQQPDPEIQLKGYICDKCDFETYSILVFARHLCNEFQLPTLKNKTKLKHGEKEDTSSLWFKCEQYSFQSKLRKDLKMHILSKHANPSDEVKWLQCEQCSFKTKTNNIMKKHISWKHSDTKKEKRFQCEQCPFKAATNTHLKRHILYKHLDSEEVKWFQCEQCSFKTKTNSNLKSHISVKHLNPEEVRWLFQCKQCPYKSKKNDNLKRHMMTRKH